MQEQSRTVGTDHKGEHVMKDAAYAQDIIAKIEREVKSPKKRKALAAAFATNIFGKLSPAAVQVYLDYAA